MPEKISRAARKHLRPSPDAAPPPPARSAAGPTPAPAPKPAVPPAPVVLPWAQLAKAIKGVTDPLYVKLGATPPPVESWEGFTDAWGAVVDYYLPSMQNTPLPKAILATLIVAAPLYEAVQKKQAEKKAAAEQRAAAGMPQAA